MKPNQFIRKIRNYSLISFLLPLVTLNLCLFLFQILGHTIHKNFDWSGDKNIPIEKFIYTQDSFESLSFTNCPKYKYDYYYITGNNEEIISTEWHKNLPSSVVLSNKISDYKENIKVYKNLDIKYVKFKFRENINEKCIKNNKLAYLLLTNFKTLEKNLVSLKKDYYSGRVIFGLVENPYLYGEVSISRTARYYPANFIFKPLIILSSIFLFLYWLNNLSLFREILNSNTQNNFSKKFFYLGSLSCIFLILHAALLGLDFNSNLFDAMRRAIIILFIAFEVSAQVLLTSTLLKFKKELINYINPMILKIKIIFVTVVILATVIIFTYLLQGDLKSSTKHLLEWNYFSILLLYYFLSRLLWKLKKPSSHTR